MPYRQPLSVEDYIAALGDDEAELTHVMTLGEGYANSGPRVWGQGSTMASTSTELARRDELVWDTNGYYRDVGFPDGAAMVLGGYRSITRRDIFNAVKKRGIELGDSRQSYCVKQLLNRAGRADYDATVLGQVVFDQYWENYFKRQAEDEAAKMHRQGVDIDVADILERWGLQVDQTDPMEDSLDWGEVPEEVDEAPPIESTWDWPFYVWAARSVNLSYLEEWQRLLSNAIRQNARMGRRYLALREFAVGVMGFGNSPSCPESKVHLIGSDLVFFLRSDVMPTKQKAKEAIKELLDGVHNLEIRVRD